MKIKRAIYDISLWVLGSAVFSLSVNMFSAPYNIVLGGLTGVATVINHLFPLVPIGTAIFLMNIPLFILAGYFLKGGFLLKTVLATAVFTAFIDIGSLFIKPFEGDILLGCVFCGVFSGTGLALVFMTGATTGGTDIVAMLLRHKNPRLSVGRLFLIIDMSVVLLSFLVFGKIESIMYALIIIFLSSRAIDVVLYGNEHSKMVLIITEKSDEILSSILTQIGRGATVIPAIGGYTLKEKKLILCAAKKTQIRNILRLISQKDPKAFTVVCDALEVSGEGFRQ